VQLAIDILQETPAALRLAAQFLLDHAKAIEASQGNTAAAPVPPPPQMPPAPPAFVPPTPPASSAMAPATSTASQNSAPVPAPPGGGLPVPPPPPPVPSNVTVLPTALNAALSAATVPPLPVAPPSAFPATNTPLELDSSGMPYDPRIHQKTKGKKRDSTWKLQKGIDQALVTAVTQELHARMINSTPSAPPANVPPPPPPTAPSVGIPPIPPPGALPPHPVGVPADVQGSQSVHVPQPPDVGVPNAGHASVVQPTSVGPAADYRALVNKLTAARNAGKLSGEQLTSLLQQTGVPSLQLLGSMLHLVPTVDAYLDAHLLSVG
jgi:hypothetical protein